MAFRPKSERELKWEQEHAEEIADSLKVMKEQSKREWVEKKAENEKRKR